MIFDSSVLNNATSNHWMLVLYNCILPKQLPKLATNPLSEALYILSEKLMHFQSYGGISDYHDSQKIQNSKHLTAFL